MKSSPLKRLVRDWRISLLTAVLLPLFVCLGFWQLQRADVHRKMESTADARREQAPVNVLQIKDWLQPDALQYLPVTLQGRWLQPVFLLDNQTRQQKPGYDVIGVMQLEDGRQMLVNRGWVAGMALRTELPVIPATTDFLRESAELYVTPELLAAEPIYAEGGWPRRIAKLRVQGVAAEAHLDVLPVLARLKEGSPSAFVVGWPVTNIAPEKNIAYAIQWFAMAAALVVFYLALMFRREPNRGDNQDG